ncbi:MAG: phosphatidylserine/phosphatidylglycerophosphate/cardiolipin synthase family protein [Gemmatimonadaceae bacterium]
MKLLVDSDEFWSVLSADIRSAQDAVYIQTLSFEGDRVGTALVDALDGSACHDRRILVDAYTRVIQNDRFLYSPASLFDRELRAEVRATSRLIERARERGIGVQFTNPMGPLLVRLPARNHKKMMVIDDRVCYLGGLNFSEHNFAWHDLMVRIEDPAIAAFLKQDFLSTWAGDDVPRTGMFPGIDVHCCDGRTNAGVFQRVFDCMEAARESIFVESPYLTSPFCEKLAEARRRGVRVTIVSPEANNHTPMKKYIIRESRRHDFDLRLYQGRMTHLKAMLVDDRWLIVGSSNFDVLSYYLHQETVAIVTDPDLIADFQERVMRLDLDQSHPIPAGDGGLGGLFAYGQVQLAAKVALLLCRPAAAS